MSQSDLINRIRNLCRLIVSLRLVLDGFDSSVNGRTISDILRVVQDDLAAILEWLGVADAS